MNHLPTKPWRTLSSGTHADPALGEPNIGIWRSYQGLRAEQPPTQYPQTLDTHTCPESIDNATLLLSSNSFPSTLEA